MLKNLTLDNCSSNIGINNIVMNSNQIYYLIKKRWIKWNKAQDEIDETKINETKIDLKLINFYQFLNNP